MTMQASTTEQAAQTLLTARRERRPLVALPQAIEPTSFAEAEAIQRALVAQMGETVPAYKVVETTPETSMWAPILGSVFAASPARFAAADMPLLGLEAEIAFRLDDDFTAADRTITEADFDARTTIVPTIEIVATRFESYKDSPFMHRAADFMSNGALIHGSFFPEARGKDLTQVAIKLYAGGELICDTVGGHMAKDPRLPALAFLRAPGRPDRLPAGTIITAGSFTGLLFARPGDTVTAKFADFGEVSVSLTA